MKIALLTSNLGNFDKDQNNEEQTLTYDYFCFTDKNFPPRSCSMTPRLQARIPKMSGLQMVPNYDIYVWLDSSCRLSKKDSLETLIKKCNDEDLLVFKHPNRNSILEEANYLKKRLDNNCPYITPRYKNERVDDQLDIIKKEGYVDKNLFATTCIVYKNNKRVDNMMKEWWYHTSMYHSIDQLSFPYVIWKHNCSYSLEQEPYTKVDYLEFIRNK